MAGKEPGVSKDVKKQAAKALASRNLARPLRDDWVEEEGVRMLSVKNSVAIEVKLARPLPGRWTVHLNWLFQPIPPDGELALLRASFGLNVAGLTKPPVAGTQNLVRYDIDHGRLGPDGETLGRHINVWQPPPIDDHVHFPVMDGSTDPWTVDEVLTFFLSQSLADDLNGRLA